MIDDKRLDEIQARAAKAAKGPWKCEELTVHERPRGLVYCGKAPNPMIVADVYAGKNLDRQYYCDEAYEIDSNAVFIAESRNDVPDLVAEVRRLNAENTKLREELSRTRFERTLAQDRARGTV